MCTFLKGDYERYKVKKEKQLADGGHMGRIIGIDLGTTNSAAAVWENGESHLIPNAFGDYLTPSVVSIGKDGTVYVGKIAKERLVTHPEDTVSVFKRFMGTEKIYSLAGKKYRPEELSALVLKRLRKTRSIIWGRRLRKRSSVYRHILTTLQEMQQKMRGNWQDFMWSASSMNLRLHRYIISAEARWRMPSCWCLILEGERSMCH